MCMAVAYSGNRWPVGLKLKKIPAGLMRHKNEILAALIRFCRALASCELVAMGTVAWAEAALSWRYTTSCPVERQDPGAGPRADFAGRFHQGSPVVPEVMPEDSLYGEAVYGEAVDGGRARRARNARAIP